MTKHALHTLLVCGLLLCAKPAFAAIEEPRKNDNPPESSTRRNDNPTEVEIVKPNSQSGEPIFDWKKHEGETQVEHPFAEKGLIRIDKDDVYYYKVEETHSNTAVSFQFGIFNPTNLKNPDSGATFQQNYAEGGPNPAFFIDKEWQLWRGVLGKLGLRAGSGLFTANGHGHFVKDNGDGNFNKTPLENFTFIAFPNDFGAVYRAQFLHRQLLVPYVQGGGTLFAFAEIRDDNKGPKFGGAYGAFVAGGLQINMTYFDYMTRVQLNREYGITAVYLTLEDRQIIGAIDPRYDFSSNVANLGFLIEY